MLTSQLLEALVQVVSNGPNAGQAELTLAEPIEPNAADAAARRWVRMGGEPNRGRFVPVAEEELRARREGGLLA